MEMVIVPVIVAMELEIKNEEVEFQCQSSGIIIIIGTSESYPKTETQVNVFAKRNIGYLDIVARFQFVWSLAIEQSGVNKTFIRGMSVSAISVIR